MNEKMSEKTSLPVCRLITIPFSHYCERARWGLDHAGVAYVEEAHLPGLHLRSMKKAGGRTVPVLVTPEGSFTDSADILRYCDAKAPAERKLYPVDPAARSDVDALEELCNRPLGKAARLFIYHHTLSSPRGLLAAVRPGLTRLQARLFPFAVPLVRPLIKKRYHVDGPNAEKALATIREVFAEVGARLGSKRWLVGDRLTAAEITFASLAAPLLRPAGHPATSGSMEALKEPLRSVVLELRATPAGAHALRVYEGHRSR
jgi:glutathione S-transferase